MRISKLFLAAIFASTTFTAMADDDVVATTDTTVEYPTLKLTGYNPAQTSWVLLNGNPNIAKGYNSNHGLTFCIEPFHHIIFGHEYETAVITDVSDEIQDYMNNYFDGTNFAAIQIGLWRMMGATVEPWGTGFFPIAEKMDKPKQWKLTIYAPGTNQAQMTFEDVTPPEADVSGTDGPISWREIVTTNIVADPEMERKAALRSGDGAISINP